MVNSISRANKRRCENKIELFLIENLGWLNAFQGFFFVGLPSAEQTTLYSDSRGIPCNPYMMLDQII